MPASATAPDFAHAVDAPDMGAVSAPSDSEEHTMIDQTNTTCPYATGEFEHDSEGDGVSEIIGTVDGDEHHEHVEEHEEEEGESIVVGTVDDSASENDCDACDEEDCASVSWETASEPACEAPVKAPQDPSKYVKKVISTMKCLPFEQQVTGTKIIEVQEEATKKVPKVVKKNVQVSKQVLVKREVPYKKTVMKEKEVPCKVWKLVDSTKTIKVPIQVDSTRMVYKYKTVQETKEVDHTIYVDKSYMRTVKKCVPCKKTITVMRNVPHKKTIWVPKPCPVAVKPVVSKCPAVLPARVVHKPAVTSDPMSMWHGVWPVSKSMKKRNCH